VPGWAWRRRWKQEKPHSTDGREENEDGEGDDRQNPSPTTIPEEPDGSDELG